jgi:DNA-binding transcriptional regulator YdaS (Cro superfamily)
MEKQKPQTAPPAEKSKTEETKTPPADTDTKPVEAPVAKRVIPRRGREVYLGQDEEPTPPSIMDGIIDPSIAERGAFVRRSGEPNRGVLEAIKRLKSQRALAELMGVTQPTIGGWLWEKITAERAIELETKTGVSRRVIRPDLFAVEPELVKAKSVATKDSIHRERYGKIEKEEK